MGNQMRFVLVHGICHGAWSWYKVKTLLEAAGHCVSAIDLAASSINKTRAEDIQTLKDYSKPLLDIMDSFPSDKKTILVAHSVGGVAAALAADIFPWKTAAIVFLTSSKEVIKIKDADHLPMNSKPQELCALLLEISDRYA